MKVSLAKPVQKGKQNTGGPKSSNKDSVKEKPKTVHREFIVSSIKLSIIIITEKLKAFQCEFIVLS